MVKENVDIYNGMLLRHKKEQNFITCKKKKKKQMDLEIIILNKISQTNNYLVIATFIHNLGNDELCPQ